MPLVLNTKHNFIREMILRSNFMRSKLTFSGDRIFDHEVEFMRSNFFSFFMRSKFLIIDLIS
jgi:hypothetical protein